MRRITLTVTGHNKTQILPGAPWVTEQPRQLIEGILTALSTERILTDRSITTSLIVTAKSISRRLTTTIRVLAKQHKEHSCFLRYTVVSVSFQVGPMVMVRTTSMFTLLRFV